MLLVVIVTIVFVEFRIEFFSTWVFMSHMQCRGEVSCEASTLGYSLSLNQLSCRVRELNLSGA